MPPGTLSAKKTGTKQPCALVSQLFGSQFLFVFSLPKQNFNHKQTLSERKAIAKELPPGASVMRQVGGLASEIGEKFGEISSDSEETFLYAVPRIRKILSFFYRRF